MSERLTINELESRATATPAPFVLWLQLDGVLQKTTKSGKPFLAATFADATGSVKINIWSDHPAFDLAQTWKPGSYHQLEGKWITGSYGLDAKDWTTRPLTPEETATVLQGAGPLAQKQDVDYSTITAAIASISDPRLHLVSTTFLDRFGDRFRRAAGARGNHHARRGGLVEHVAGMLRAADAICTAYPQLNRDLLITGTFFHDVGKLWENGYPKDGFTQPFDRTAELLGHITIGIELASKLLLELGEIPENHAAWKTLEPSTQDVRLHLLHLIASHHGEHEWGSPVLPKTPEAIALHYIDNLDAKLEMFAQGYEKNPQLGPGVYDRSFPLRQHQVTPLPSYTPPPAETAPPGEEPDECSDTESVIAQK